jgi:hypothetical protein
VRGLSKSKKSGSILIPVVIIPNGVGIAATAKMFAEINTLQVPLDDLHQLFLKHRYSIPSPTRPKRNFEPWDDNDLSGTKADSRANHFAYGLVAMLASMEDSALKGRVKILEQNDTTEYYVNAKYWLDYARSWFKNGPYSDPYVWKKSSIERVYKEVNCFFLAFIRTCNHDEGWQQWPYTAHNRSILQNPNHFKALIDLYEVVYSLLREKSARSAGAFTQEDFGSVLTVFENVEWTSPKLIELFKRGGEAGRSSLAVWMKDALERSRSASKKEILSSKIQSVPGKGILAPPKQARMKLSGKWPRKNKPLLITCHRPWNALPTPSWEIVTSEGRSRKDDIRKDPVNPGVWILKHQDYMDGITWMEINVSWKNAKDSVSSRKKIRRL